MIAVCLVKAQNPAVLIHVGLCGLVLDDHTIENVVVCDDIQRLSISSEYGPPYGQLDRYVLVPRGLASFKWRCRGKKKYHIPSPPWTLYLSGLLSIFDHQFVPPPYRFVLPSFQLLYVSPPSLIRFVYVYDKILSLLSSISQSIPSTCYYFLARPPSTS
jgi:hypothetical protein